MGPVTSFVVPLAFRWGCTPFGDCNWPAVKIERFPKGAVGMPPWGTVDLHTWINQRGTAATFDYTIRYRGRVLKHRHDVQHADSEWSVESGVLYEHFRGVPTGAPMTVTIVAHGGGTTLTRTVTVRAVAS